MIYLNNRRGFIRRIRKILILKIMKVPNKKIRAQQDPKTKKWQLVAQSMSRN